MLAPWPARRPFLGPVNRSCPCRGTRAIAHGHQQAWGCAGNRTPGSGRPGTSTPPPHGQTLYSQTMAALDCMLQSFITQSPTAEELHFLLSVRPAGQQGGAEGPQTRAGSPRRAAHQKRGLDGRALPTPSITVEGGRGSRCSLGWGLVRRCTPRELPLQQ